MTMLEKAARAARKADLDWNPNDGTWHEHVARAVLMAVREPDDAMLEAANENEGCGCPCCIGAHHWPSMIDAILDGK